MPETTTALYAMPWREDHYDRSAKVSRAAGCAMHGTDVCGELAVATVVYPSERNAACARWIAEHPEVEWHEDREGSR
jgi:hypothetical protein